MEVTPTISEVSVGVIFVPRTVPVIFEETFHWGVRRVNNWINLGTMLLFTHLGNIMRSHSDLNPNRCLSQRADFRGLSRLDVVVLSNLIVPIGALAGQREVVELTMPIYRNLTGIQLKQTWRFTLGWQYAYGLL